MRAIPKKEEAKSKTEEDEDNEAGVRPEDNEMEKVRREVVESPRTPLVTQMTLPDDDIIVTRAIKVTGSAMTAAIPFL